MDCHHCLYLLCAVGIQNVIDKYQIVGIQGDDGVQGDRGLQGAQGVPGPKGQKGQRGQQGLHGLNGTQGPIGLAGSKGQKGEKGLNGLRGDAGTQGQKGGRGQAGLTGPQGPRGFLGSKGQKGETGPRGFSGSKGQKGVNGLRGTPGPTAGGVVYTRWGRTTCPNTTGTQLLYAGRTSGSHWTQRGGGANHLCLPEQPEYSTYTAGTQNGRAFLYGTEFETGGEGDGPFRSLYQHNSPCAVCYASNRGTVVMIPAKYTCPSSWTQEYYGYLMAEKYDTHRSTFECVDVSPQSIPGSLANTNGVLFYHVEATCNGIPCPPYNTQKEVMCVVCTK